MRKLFITLAALIMLGVTTPLDAQTKTKPVPAAKVTKDGKPDRRFKENKTKKKDGTPDMRYKSNKTKK
jgi:hypothetical protein